MTFRALICDLDGTLLDTVEDMLVAVNIALGKLGFPSHSLPTFKYFMGDGRRTMALRSLPEGHRDDAVLEPLLEYIGEEYTKRWMDHSVPYPGIPEMLDVLSRGGIRLAVLSNKPHIYVEPMVANILSRWSFERVLGESPAVPRKPDPTGALRIAHEMGIPSSKCVYIGDSGVDMEVARAAGMYGVGVLWGYRGRDELVDSGARALAEHPRDISALFNHRS